MRLTVELPNSLAAVNVSTCVALAGSTPEVRVILQVQPEPSMVMCMQAHIAYKYTQTSSNLGHAILPLYECA